MRNNKPIKRVVKKEPVRPDAMFWDKYMVYYPIWKRQLKKLMKYTEYVRGEGAGFLLRVTKEMPVYKRGVYYTPFNVGSNKVQRNDALVTVKIKPGAQIFIYLGQSTRHRALKLRSTAATIVSIHDLNAPEKQLGFAVSFFTKDATGEQTAYVPEKSIRLRMRSFKDECGSGFHFYVFKSEVNKLYKKTNP